jgi:hypothetical protein
MTLGSKENYINAVAIYASTGGEACLTTVFGILVASQISILDSIYTTMQAS